MRKAIVRRVDRLEVLLPPQPPVRTRIQVLFVNRDSDRDRRANFRDL